MKYLIGLIGLQCCFGVVLGAVPELPELEWSERSDWLNVTKDVMPAAMGDGTTDDTRALQVAVDTVAQAKGVDARTVYLPPGTYRISETLHLANCDGVTMIGHGRSTRIVWAGKADAERGMFWSDGVPRSRYIGMVWDGAGSAVVGHDHGSTNRFETRLRYEHVAFVNFAVAGVRTGFQRRTATAETVYKNCLFVDCGIGASIVLHNDYNHKFNGCEFRRCEVGIESRKGHVQVWNSHFEGNGTDVSHDGDQCVAVRRCTSVGSGQFVASHQAPLTIQDCQVSGWTGNDGAILQKGAPMLVFDCRFTQPPDERAPIRVAAGRVLTYSNCASPQTEALVAPMGEGVSRGGNPAGAAEGGGEVGARELFRSAARVPGRVFDVREDFGAKGDGVADDTEAVAQAIDAAREHGDGAIAYLPAGIYRVTRALSVTGGNYTIGGAGFATEIRGQLGEGAVFAVRDPQGVRLEYMVISSAQATVAAVEQTSSGGHSYVQYDGLYVPGVYWKKEPRPRGLVVRGLGNGDVVNIGHLDGEMRFTDCGRATVLGEYTYEGQILIEGTEPVRDGFMGFLFRLSTGGTTYSLTVANNHSLVLGDFYNENALRYVKLSGTPGEPAGRVTLQGARYYSKCAFGKEDAPVVNPVMLLDNYQGVFSWGHYSFDYWKPTAPPEVVQTGDRPVDVVILSTRLFHSRPLQMQMTDAAKLTLIGNAWSADQVSASGLEAAAAALDHLRELGAKDVWLNHTPRSREQFRQVFLGSTE